VVDELVLDQRGAFLPFGGILAGARLDPLVGDTQLARDGTGQLLLEAAALVVVDRQRRDRVAPQAGESADQQARVEATAQRAERRALGERQRFSHRLRGILGCRLGPLLRLELGPRP
jgi:hypothetical protein